MKRLTFLSLLAPGAAAAHGGHGPMTEPVHSVVHTGPVLLAFVVALAVGLALAQRWRS